MGRIVGDRIDERPEPGQGSGEGACRQLDAGVAIGSEVVDPGHHGSDRDCNERLTSGIDLAFRHADDLDRATVVFSRRESGLREQPPDVVEHVAAIVGLRRQAVRDDDKRQSAIPDAIEDEPRDVVGIAGCSRHEDAQVGSLDQPISEFAVGVLDAVDVGGVDEGEAGRDGWVGLDPQAFRIDPDEHPFAERRSIVGVGQNDRGPRRGPQHPRGTRGWPAIVLKIVLLPAPVGPRSSTASGASRLRARTRRCPAR